MHLATDPVNPLTPSLVIHGLSIANVLNKCDGVWSPGTRFRRPPDVAHWSTAYHGIGKSAAVGDVEGAKSDYIEEKYKIGFLIWMENIKLQFEQDNIKRGQPPLE